MGEPSPALAALVLYEAIVQILVGTCDLWGAHKPFLADRGLRKTGDWL